MTQKSNIGGTWLAVGALMVSIFCFQIGASIANHLFQRYPIQIFHGDERLAFVPAKESRQEFEAYIAIENTKWRKIIQDAGVKIE